MKSKLQEMVIKKGISLKRLSELVGVTPQAVSDICRKGISRGNTAHKYAAALGCEPMEIIENKSK